VDLASKLQLKAGQRVAFVGAPDSVASDLRALAIDQEDTQDAALLAFVADRAALEEHRAQIVAAASGDRLT
jgi:hypothetical protein